MEADLARFYGVDYRDRWRPDPTTGRPLLPWRRLGVLVEHLPPESMTATALRNGKPHWSVEAHLLDEVRMANTGTKRKPAKRHPDRPRPGPQPQRHDPAQVEAARRRIRERQRSIDAGEIP